MKKKNFWALPRLCLCLTSCSLLFSCTVSRDERKTAAPANSYILTATIHGGNDEAHLIAILADAGLMPELLAPLPCANLTGTPEYIQLRVHIRSENGRERLASRIKASGIAIGNLQIESE